MCSFFAEKMGAECMIDLLDHKEAILVFDYKHIDWLVWSCNNKKKVRPLPYGPLKTYCYHSENDIITIRIRDSINTNKNLTN